MHPSIYQEFIACKLQEDLHAAYQARLAKEPTRTQPRQERFARRRRFVRRPTSSTASPR